MSEGFRSYKELALLGSIGAMYLTRDYHSLFNNGLDTLWHFSSGWAISNLMLKQGYDSQLTRSLGVLALGASWEGLETYIDLTDGFNSDYQKDIVYNTVGSLATKLKLKKQ